MRSSQKHPAKQFAPRQREQRIIRHFRFEKPTPRHFKTLVIMRPRRASSGGGGARWFA